MLRYVTHQRNLFSACLLTFALALTACGGGGGGETPGDGGTGGTPPEAPTWPQTLEFRDFTGVQAYFRIAGSGGTGHGGGGGSSCQTCITVYGIAQSSLEMGKLLPDWKTYSDWPAPYNSKLFSELPIDYSTKTAVVLEDLGSGDRYQYAVKKVEEFAEAVTITVLKCTVYEVYADSATIQLGLLIPKTTKPIQVVLVQSGKPTFPAYGPNGLGAC
ncbi:MAG: hypothetical protein K1X48_04710 [Burkholderiaceae bacterium]|nr:hypothetical protein [Burkholderiaceae bacterium]